jgi:hypothetical protein
VLYDTCEPPLTVRSGCFVSPEQSLLRQLPIPFTFTFVGLGSDRFEYATQALSILPDGFVITSRRKLRIGDFLSLRLRMPPGTPEGFFSEIRRIARVMAELPRQDGAFCYQVGFEFMPPPA